MDSDPLCWVGKRSPIEKESYCQTSRHPYLNSLLDPCTTHLLRHPCITFLLEKPREYITYLRLHSSPLTRPWNRTLNLHRQYSTWQIPHPKYTTLARQSGVGGTHEDRNGPTIPVYAMSNLIQTPASDSTLGVPCYVDVYTPTCLPNWDFCTELEMQRKTYCWKSLKGLSGQETQTVAHSLKCVTCVYILLHLLDTPSPQFNLRSFYFEGK